MKFCPFCGVSLVEGAAFCVICGRTIPTDTASPPAKQPERKRRRRPATKQAKGRPEKPSRPKPEDGAETPDQDAGYDGYYNDVLPKDSGAEQSRMDADLLKRIIGVGAGALVIIVLSVVLMYFL